MMNDDKADAIVAAL